MSRIFVSYRRSDSNDSVRKIIRSLEEHLPRGAIFFDQVDVLPGQDFRLRVYEELLAADLVIVAIGGSWLAEFGRRAQAREAGAAEDHLLIEIETAIRLGKLVLPLLIDGATLPEDGQLPVTIRELGRRNMRSIDPDLSSDVDAFASEVLELLRRALRQRLERITERTGIPTPAIELVLEAVKMVAAQTDPDSLLPAAKIWEATLLRAQTTFGSDWQRSMRKIKLQQSEDLGVIVFCLMLDGILCREPTDEPGDFWSLGAI